MSETQHLRDRIAGRATEPKCPLCGARTWKRSAVPVVLPAVTDDGSLAPGRGYPVDALFCTGCGFVRTHLRNATDA